jgi:hypothetical protein
MALVFTIDEDDTVLELLEEQEDGLAVRTNGDWVPVATDEEQPTIFDIEWVDVKDEAIEYWDEAHSKDGVVTRSDISQFLTSSE